METELLVQHGMGRSKKVPLMEAACPADKAGLSSVPGPKLLVIRDAAIEDLISKIESILPDVAAAGQELRMLRRLFEEELAATATLRSESASRYQQAHLSGGLLKR